MLVFELHRPLQVRQNNKKDLIHKAIQYGKHIMGTQGIDVRADVHVLAIIGDMEDGRDPGIFGLK